MPSESEVLDALRGVKFPGYSRDVVSFGLVKNITAASGAVTVRIELTSANTAAANQIKADAEQALRKLPGVTKADVQVFAQTASPPPTSATFSQNRLPHVAKIIAIASGKGGVGKSTVSVNLACALQRLGARVGLLDCDIYGPSIPLMMGVNEKPGLTKDDRMIPPSRHGVKLMSLGFLVEGDAPVIWRGPMITKTIQQFLLHVDWGELDYLLVDLPPGTGDAQLSLCQTVPLDGGVVVTTPQEASVGIVRKGIAMFEKVQVPLLGIVENMSYYTTPTGDRVEIFGHGGGRTEAQRRGVAFLGEIPLFPEIRIGGDEGRPIVTSAPETAAAQPFMEIAANLKKVLSQ